MIHLLLAVIYVSFISLGLPDSLLGAAWPSIYQGFGVPVTYSGVIFCIISVGTVISSLQSDRLTQRFGAGGVTAISVAMTATALCGFSVSNSFWALCVYCQQVILKRGADEILDQMRSLTGGGHAHVFLRRTIEGRSALYPV